MGAGILPYAEYNNKIYFLFSREYIDGKVDSGLWSDFGGKSEKNELYFDTAVREGFEESSGFLGDQNTIKKLVEKKTLFQITRNKYTTYIVKIKYDKTLPKKFRDNFLQIKKTHPELIDKKNGLYEKDQLKWIESSVLKNKINLFRPWYRNIVRELLSKI